MAAGYPATVDFRGKILPRFDGTYHYVYPNGDELSTFTIANASGSVSQGSQITLDVSNNTYKRDGQLKFLCGDTSQLGVEAVDGQIAERPGAASNYKHSSEDSFMGSGASLKAEMALGSGGSDDAYFDTGDATEVFMSVLRKVVPVTYRDPLTGANPQMKCERLTGPPPPGGGTTPFLGTTYFWDVNGTEQRSVINLNPASSNPWASFNNPHGDFFTEDWFRTMMYLKSSDEGLYNGSAFMARINENTGEVFFGATEYETNRNLNDPDLTGAITPFWVPKHKHITANDPGGRIIDKAWLAHFMYDESAMNTYADGIFLNDSLERVEFGNASTYDACTKRVIQKQDSRKIRYIDVDCYMGNLSDTDDIYAFVFNADGTYTPGYLVRGAIA